MEKYVLELQAVLDKYRSLGISQQIDYDKFYLYSIITHSTAIEGSTVTEIENQLLFDEGISAKRAQAIVKAVTNYNDPKMLAELSEDLGEAMVGINEQEIALLMAERGK